MSALGDEIRAMIVSEGPITVERFMELALAHPDLGYYMNRDPFGAQGDFTTAPEISQMYGELLGLWAAEVWTSMGRPKPIRLIELGPGRGTLMSDALARRAHRAGLSRRSRRHADRDQPDARQHSIRGAADRRRADRLVRDVGRGAGRPRDHSRQRVPRRLAGAPIRAPRRTVA